MSLNTKRSAARGFKGVALFIGVLAGLPLVVISSGCSVVMASRQPSRKNLSYLAPGTERDLVIAEFGLPVSSDRLPDGGRKDIYTFVQGYSTGAKFTRALLHGGADVMTLGLWEAAGTPIEAAFDGKKITVRVIFGPDDRISKSETLLVAKP